MAFTAKDVQTLRERTGCGMMDCKKALTETDGDMDKAIEVLREKGLASQAKKAGRIAAEGTVCAIVENGVGVVVELNAETDFVAKGEDFNALARKVAKIIIAQNPADVDALLKCTEDGMTVEEMVQELFLKIRENIRIRRFVRIEGDVVTYVHAGGKIGVMVQFETDVAGKDGFEDYAKDVAMQIAAINPQYLDRTCVPADVLEKEKEIYMAQTLNEGKPANIAEKIVMGRINKFYKEVCLVDQEFVKDGSMTIAKYTESKAKELGGSIKIAQFVRFEKGEGLEKRSDNFADEVASMVK